MKRTIKLDTLNPLSAFAPARQLAGGEGPLINFSAVGVPAEGSMKEDIDRLNEQLSHLEAKLLEIRRYL